MPIKTIAWICKYMGCKRRSASNRITIEIHERLCKYKDCGLKNEDDYKYKSGEPK